MADDWEQDDWEADNFKPALPASGAAGGGKEGTDFETVGQALLAKATEPDMSKFADEDQEEPEEDKGYHIKPQVGSCWVATYVGHALTAAHRRWRAVLSRALAALPATSSKRSHVYVSCEIGNAGADAV
jgi:hypothetical protein